MTIKELKNRKTPIVVINKSLEKYKGLNLFPEKLAKANDVLKRIGLPKIVIILGTERISENHNRWNLSVKRVSNSF